MRLWLWTDDPALAAQADAAGVDRIGIDIERLGKAARQAGHDSWLSPHELTSLPALARVVVRGDLFVRVNGWHAGSGDEVEAALDGGARVLMLPNFTTLDEVAACVAAVRGRAVVVPLVERVAALDLVGRFPSLGISEFHVGFHDLSIELGLSPRIAMFLHPGVARACAVARDAGLRFGLAGVARVDDTTLPIPPVLVIAQHARLGSTGALIARSFLQGAPPGFDMAQGVADLRSTFAACAAAPDRAEAGQRLKRHLAGEAP